MPALFRRYVTLAAVPKIVMAALLLDPQALESMAPLALGMVAASDALACLMLADHARRLAVAPVLLDPAEFDFDGREPLVDLAKRPAA